MEGNVDMVLPTTDTLLKGPEEVLRWSERRLGASQFARAQNILLTVQDVLKQVGKYKIGGLNGMPSHHSLYEQNVSQDG
eukprot:11635859-Ditylum_brightwellii.AAC.1